VKDTRTGRWLLREPRPDAQARLICFPYAGAGASSLRRWPQRIGAMEVCAVQPPGRENRFREPAYHSFDDFAADAAEGLAPYLDRPYALFGHCMGALLAYATLVRLEERGHPLPARLFVSSTLVPHRGFYGLFQPSMSDERLADELRGIVRGLGEPEPLPELLPMAIAVLRNDVDMCYRYRPPGPRPLPCPITAIGWRDDPYVPAPEMLEWDGYGQTRHEVLAGGPWTFLSAPPELVEVIERDAPAVSTAAPGARGGAAW
jgi:surfactin synthase thioesterase subunit